MTDTHPDHYARSKVEPVDLIEALGWGPHSHKGNALKYIARAGHKPGASEAADLTKAIDYLQRALKLAKLGVSFTDGVAAAEDEAHANQAPSPAQENMERELLAHDLAMAERADRVAASAKALLAAWDKPFAAAGIPGAVYDAVKALRDALASPAPEAKPAMPTVRATPCAVPTEAGLLIVKRATDDPAWEPATAWAGIGRLMICDTNGQSRLVGCAYYTGAQWARIVPPGEGIPAPLEHAHPGDAAAPVAILRPRAEYHEDFGPVLWWAVPIEEAPLVGTDGDSDFPDYMTHWSVLPVPPANGDAHPA